MSKIDDVDEFYKSDFQAAYAIEDCVNDIAAWFKKPENRHAKAVIRLNGRDGANQLNTLVNLSLCIKALGKENIMGICFTRRSDFVDIIREHYGIEKYAPFTREHLFDETLSLKGNIESSFRYGMNETESKEYFALIYIAIMYGYASCGRGRIINPMNLTEVCLGTCEPYCNLDNYYSPLGNLTYTEVHMMAEELGVPEDLLKEALRLDYEDTYKQIEKEYKFSQHDLDLFMRYNVKKETDNETEDYIVNTAMNHLEDKNLRQGHSDSDRKVYCPFEAFKSYDPYKLNLNNE